MAMKSYLRYEPAESFGVICSPHCNVAYDTAGNLAIAGANSSVNVINLRTGAMVGTVQCEDGNYPYTIPGDVSVLCTSSDRQTVAAGYSTGEVRLVNYLKCSVIGTFRGHRTRVTALCYSGSGNAQARGGGGEGRSLLLASGGGDCDIICWDVVSMTAKCKLRGHKGTITGLTFVSERGASSQTSPAGRSYLVSSSVDTLLKVWDLDTHTCIQTVTGHRSEVWSLTSVATGLSWSSCGSRGIGDEEMEEDEVESNGSSNAKGGIIKNTDSGGNSSSDARNDELILTGSADEFLRGYAVCWDRLTNADTAALLQYVGSVKRSGGASDKCTSMDVSREGLVVAQSSGKSVDLFRLRTPEEAKRKRAKRRKKEAMKGKRRDTSFAHGADASSSSAGDAASGHYSLWEEEVEKDGDNAQTTAAATAAAAAAAATATSTGLSDTSAPLQLNDVLEPRDALRCSARTRSAVFAPSAAIVGGGASGVRAKGKNETLLISLINNSLETYNVPVEDREAQVAKLSCIDHMGHRSDVRAVTLSRDGRMIATCGQEGVKIWSGTTFQCLRSAQSGYALCVVFAPGDQFLLVGSKDGAVEVIDALTAESVDVYDAHTAEVWAMSLCLKNTCLMTCSGDKCVKIWELGVSEAEVPRDEEGGDGAYDVTSSARRNILVLRQKKVLQMSHDALACCVSPVKDAKKALFAVGLLDNTIKVFFEDSLKFFLSLYGHTLPVTAVDISTDGTLLVSGSADKSIKVWGLDFGDCHRSLLGHKDSVTSVSFQPETHYFFSTDKAGDLRYWDADRFEQILVLPGHRSVAWSAAITRDCSKVITAGQDRSIRVWQRTDDMVFIEEEKERHMEAQVEAAITKEAGLADAAADGVGDMVVEGGGDANNASAAAAVGLRGLESVKGGERLMETMDLVSAELKAMEQEEAKGADSVDGGGRLRTRRTANPILQNMHPLKFLMKTLAGIKAPDLEQALLVLPFHYVKRLFEQLVHVARDSTHLELCARVATFLLKVHFTQVTVTSELTPSLLTLQKILTSRLGEYRLMIGANVAGLRIMHREVREDATAYFIDVEPTPPQVGVEKKDKKKNRNKRKEAKRKRDA